MATTEIERPSLNYFKSETRNICHQKGWAKITIEQLWILLMEEIGELASAVRQNMNLFRNKNKKKRGADLESEMADVFSYLFQLADFLDIDMDSMWDRWKVKSQGKRYDTGIPKRRHDICTQTETYSIGTSTPRGTEEHSCLLDPDIEQ